MTGNELDQYSEIIISVLSKSVVKINKWRERFMLEVLLLYMIIPGRINFLQLGRYGHFEGQFHEPSFFIKIGNIKCRYVFGICQKSEFTITFFILESDDSE